MLNNRILVGLILACAILFPLAMAGNNGVPVFLEANLDRHMVSVGDTFTITGTMTGTPSQSISIWIIGNDESYSWDAVPDSNGNFARVFYPEMTDLYSLGKYNVVVQHPGGNGIFDIHLKNGKGYLREGESDTKIFGLDSPYQIGSYRGDDSLWILNVSIAKTDDITEELHFHLITPTPTPTSTPTPTPTPTATTTATITETTTSNETTTYDVSGQILNINSRLDLQDQKINVQEERLDEQESFIDQILSFLNSIFNWDWD